MSVVTLTIVIGLLEITITFETTFPCFISN
jgi:hypothetical protein